MRTTFLCGHPRTPENSVPTANVKPDGTRYMQCRFCKHVRGIVISAERHQKRINAGGYTRGERVASGL